MTLASKAYPSAAAAPARPGSETITTGLTWAAFVVSLIALAGSLWLSLEIGKNLKACPLCYYQRTFVMAAAGVLAIGLLLGSRQYTLVSLFALPAVAGGLGVAVWHEYLRATGVLECPHGLFGFTITTHESLAILTILFGLLVVIVVRDVARKRQERTEVWRTVAGLAGAVILGPLFAWGAVQTVAKGPNDYNKSVDEDGCRKVVYLVRPDALRRPGPGVAPLPLPQVKQAKQVGQMKGVVRKDSKTKARG
jgi:disulfide bond formation protein DsbB